MSRPHGCADGSRYKQPLPSAVLCRCALDLDVSRQPGRGLGIMTEGCELWDCFSWWLAAAGEVSDENLDDLAEEFVV